MWGFLFWKWIDVYFVRPIATEMVLRWNMQWAVLFSITAIFCYLFYYWKKKDLLPVKTIIIKILTKICIFCVFPLTDYSEMESSHHKECCCLYLLDEGTYSVYKMKDLLKRSACHWIINKIHIDFYYLQLQAAFKTIGKTNQIFPNRFMSYWELLTISYGRVNISLLK